MIDIIKGQTKILLMNVENALLAADMEQLVDGIPNSRYLYHTIHSLDKWFINPYDYSEPADFPSGADRLNTESAESFSRERLTDYFNRVQAKINAYLDGLTTEMLTEKPYNCSYTRLELIMGQLRHGMCHVGIIMGAALAENRPCPEYIGLDGVFK